MIWCLPGVVVALLMFGAFALGLLFGIGLAQSRAESRAPDA